MAKNYTPPKSGDELLRRYRSGERYFAGAELDSSTHDLRNAELEGADLSRSFITADFSGSNLRGASFANSNIKTCDFSDADLRGAHFFGSSLEGTMFAGANLEGADFEGAYCFGRRFEAGERPWW